MLRFVFAFLTASLVLAKSEIVEVAWIEDVMPLLTSLIANGASLTELSGVPEQQAEMIPMPRSGNLQGTISSGMNNLVQAFGNGASSGASLVKGVQKQIPLIGGLLPSHVLGIGQNLFEGAQPSLPPVTPPEDLERTVADIGAKTAAAKNTIAAVTSLAPHAIASHAKKVGAFFDAQSNKLLQFPNEKNQLLQFERALFESYFAGAEAATKAVPTQELRNELKGLVQIQPHLTTLLGYFEKPHAAGTLASLGKVFEIMKIRGTTERTDESADVGDSLLVDPTFMKLGFANIALNFLKLVDHLESAAFPQIASDE